MNTPLNLSEVSKLMSKLSMKDAVENQDVFDFISRVHDSGKEILRGKGGEYIVDASDFILAGVMAELIDSSDQEDMMIAMSISQNPTIFKLIVGYAFIYSVGLCVTEELR